MTGSEKVLWGRMCSTHWPGDVVWESQTVVMGYIPDFWEPVMKVVVEVDGGIHNLRRVKRNDARKDMIFRRAGIKVFRFTNQEVEQDPSRIVMLLRKELSHRHLTRTEGPSESKPRAASRTRRRVYGQNQIQSET